MEFARTAGIAVLSQVIELLRSKVEYGALIVLFRRGEVQGPARANVERQSIGGFPIVLHKVLLDLIPRPDLALLQIDLKGIHLAKKKTGD